MSTISASKKLALEQIEHLSQAWATVAAQIGLTPTQVTSLTTRTTAARNAYESSADLRADSKAGTIAWHTAFASMDDMAKDLVKTIRAYAETTHNPNVYGLAEIPPPKTPSPLGVPTVPTDLTASVTALGTVEIAWTGSLEGGTQFNVERQSVPLNGSPAAWVSIAVVPEKKFTDVNVPKGVAGVSYRVLAQRTGGVSDASDTKTINFGTAPGSSGVNELKIAA